MYGRPQNYSVDINQQGWYMAFQQIAGMVLKWEQKKLQGDTPLKLSEEQPHICQIFYRISSTMAAKNDELGYHESNFMFIFSAGALRFSVAIQAKLELGIQFVKNVTYPT